MNLPYILRKYFGGNLHFKRKWKARIEKGKVKVVENLKRLWVVWLLGFEKRWDNSSSSKKKKKTPLIEYSNNIVISMSILSRKSYGVDLVDTSFIVFFSTKYFPNLLWFSISISFLALTLWPIITTLIKDLLISDFGFWLH